jgi:hypothetical protein
MKGTLTQTNYQPGATLTLRVVLTEFDLPVEGRAKVVAQLVRPDGTMASLTLSEVQGGVFETQLTAALHGIYSIRLQAAGKTLRGQPFTREQALTGVVWRGGDKTPPSCDPSGTKKVLCCLLNCLTSNKVLTPELQKKLDYWGFNLDALQKCLRDCCSKKTAVHAALGSITALKSGQ